jgi:hypothetical protein
MTPGLKMKNTQTPASRGPHPKPPNNAEIVFARVLKLLQQKGQGGCSSNVPGQDWLKKKHTILDVQEEVTKAQEKYNLRSQGKVRKWLARFSSGVLYYGRILDVLVQHHPEYVSLAWGTTKLLFVVSSQKDLLSYRSLSRGACTLGQLPVTLTAACPTCLSPERDQNNPKIIPEAASSSRGTNRPRPS